MNVSDAKLEDDEQSILQRGTHQAKLPSKTIEII
jgi:hypothetical protein